MGGVDCYNLNKTELGTLLSEKKKIQVLDFGDREKKNVGHYCTRTIFGEINPTQLSGKHQEYMGRAIVKCRTSTL